jgi:hypothetical protein
MTRAAREGVALERCPLTAAVAPHQRGEERLSDELAASRSIAQPGRKRRMTGRSR